MTRYRRIRAVFGTVLLLLEYVAERQQKESALKTQKCSNPSVLLLRGLLESRWLVGDDSSIVVICIHVICRTWWRADGCVNDTSDLKTEQQQVGKSLLKTP